MSQNGNHSKSTGAGDGGNIKSNKRQNEETNHHDSEVGGNLKKSKPHEHPQNNHENGSTDDILEENEVISAYHVEEDDSTADSDPHAYLDNGDEGHEEVDEDDLEDLPEKFQSLQWEEDYVKKMAEYVGANGGKILQIGFGTGIGASAIQECPGVTEHFIVEDDDEIIDYLESWASNHPNVTILRAHWEEATKDFPDNEFDGVLFYLHPHLPEIQHSSQFEFISKVGYRVLKKGGHLSYCNLRSWDDHMKTFENNIMKMFEETQLEKLKEIGFSDDNIEMELEQVSVPEDCKYYSHEQVMLVKLTK